MKAQFVFEKFEADSDPIEDMHIGLKPQIQRWIDQAHEWGMFKCFDLQTLQRDGVHYLDKGNIMINKKLQIDFYNAWVDLSSYTEPLPSYIKINHISGDFSCNYIAFPLKKLPKRVTHRLKYFVPPQKFNKYTEEMIKQYCNAKHITIDKSI